MMWRSQGTAAGLAKAAYSLRGRMPSSGRAARSNTVGKDEGITNLPRTATTVKRKSAILTIERKNAKHIATTKRICDVSKLEYKAAEICNHH